MQSKTYSFLVDPVYMNALKNTSFDSGGTINEELCVHKIFHL